MKALFFGVEIRAPKAQLKRKSPETSHDSAASILEHPVARFCDRVALLARAFVDPRFNEQWVNLAAPVSAEKRSAVTDKNIIPVINAKWAVLAEAIVENRLSYENIYYDLTVKGNFKPCLIIFHFHHIYFIFDTLNSDVGVDGVVLQNEDPSNGSFADTPAVPKGAQLKALHTKMRSMFIRTIW